MSQLRATVTLDVQYGGRKAGSVLSYSDLNRLLSLMTQMPDHLKLLDIEVHPFFIHNVINVLQQLSAPSSVEHMSISVSSNDILARIRLTRDRFPALRSVELVGLSIHKQSDVLPQLHVLKLRRYPLYAPMMGRDELQEILQYASSLRTLELCQFLHNVFPRDEAVPDQVPFLRLPALRTFMCEDHAQAIRHFLQEVDIGPNTCAHLTADVLVPEVQHPDLRNALVKAVQNSFRKGDELYETYLRIHALYEENMRWRHEDEYTNVVQEPADYQPTGLIFPSSQDSITLLRSITHINLKWHPTGFLELVGTSDSHTNGRLVCRMMAKDNPVAKYIMTTSVMCCICAHIMIARDAPLKNLKVEVALDHIYPMGWYQIIRAAPHLTELHVHDTGREELSLQRGKGVFAVFEALSLVCDPRPLHREPLIIRRLRRVSADQVIVAARLEKVTISGAEASVDLIRTIRTKLSIRASQLGRAGILQNLTLYLHAADPPTAIAAVQAERALLERWARTVETELTMTITRMH